MGLRPSKPGVAGSFPAGRTTIFIGVSADQPLQNATAVGALTPPKSSAIQRTPCPAAGTAGTVLPFGPSDPEVEWQKLARRLRAKPPGPLTFAVLVLALLLGTSAAVRWAETPPDVDVAAVGVEGRV